MIETALGVASSSRWLARFGLFFVIALGLPLPVGADAPTDVGLEVTAVPDRSALHSAGIRVGDRLVGWERLGSASGSLTHRFEWEFLRVEEAPRGTIVLDVERGGEGLRVEVEPGEWLADVRPAGEKEALVKRLVGGLTRSPIEVSFARAKGLEEWDQETVEQLFEKVFDMVRVPNPKGLFLAVGQGLYQVGLWDRSLLVLEVGRKKAEISESSAIDFALGRAWLRLDRFDDARDAFGRARDAAVRSRGEESFEVARAELAIGSVNWEIGELDLAQERFERALRVQEKIAPGSLPVAETLLRLGEVDLDRSALESGEETLDRAREIFETLAPRGLGFAESLHLLGATAMRAGNLDEADSYLHKALDLRREVDPIGLEVASSQNELGILFRRRGDLDAAVASYRAALRTRERLVPGSLDVANTLNNLGVVSRARGELSKAESYHREALGYRERLSPGGFDVAESLNNLAVVAMNRGDLGLAESTLRRTLEIRRKLLPGSLDVANSLNNLGAVARIQGEVELSRNYHERALAIRQEQAPESASTATSLSNLGAVARRLGEDEEATGYFLEALALRRRIAPRSLDVARSLHAVAMSLPAAENQRSRLALAQAQEIVEELAPESLFEAELAMTRGELAFESGDKTGALAEFSRALELRGRWAPDSESESEAHHAVGRVLWSDGKRAEAVAHLEEGLDALEKQVSRLSRSRDVRSGFRARFGALYRDTIDLYLEMENPHSAFLTLERYRAREFLTMLVERDLLFETDLPGELARKRQSLAVRLDRAERRLARHSAADPPEAIEESRVNLRLLQKDRDLLAAEIREASPRLADLSAPAPRGVPEVQRALDSDTALLSYIIGDEGSTLFVLTRDAISVFALDENHDSLRDQVAAFRELVRKYRPADPVSALYGPSLHRLAGDLYEALVAPAEEVLVSSRRLVFLPDGPLHQLPFSALLRRDSEGDPRYLVEWKSLERVASATLYSWNRESSDVAAGAEPRCRKQLIGFADPLFPDGAGSSGVPWPRLPFAREELEAAREIVSPEESELYVGAEATESRAKEVLSDGCILHFATHAGVEPGAPLNSSLVLGRSADNASGAETENGRLEVWEIFDELRIDADLVILSACGSALGEDLGGEGLLGLTRAFHYAGARAVLATLWNVADRSGPTLLAELYRGLEAGTEPAEALRQAQMRLIRSDDGEFTAPYYWAAFTLSEGR